MHYVIPIHKKERSITTYYAEPVLRRLTKANHDSLLTAIYDQAGRYYTSTKLALRT